MWVVNLHTYLHYKVKLACSHVFAGFFCLLSGVRILNHLTAALVEKNRYLLIIMFLRNHIFLTLVIEHR